MSARPARAASARTRPRPRRAPAGSRRRRTMRRRLGALLGVAALAAIVAAVLWPLLNDAAKEITLPLRHEDIIRQQADDKNLDPSLIAAVIYAESKFRDQTSHAGAQGLMQIVPDTARFIARESGGTRFELADLSTPQVNISYGSFYLRYLLDRYSANEVLALAAYNGGEGNVDRWLVEARERKAVFAADQIPFPETRAYVDRVLDAREAYRDNYADELGIG